MQTQENNEVGRFSSIEFIEDRQFDFATGRAIELISKVRGRAKAKQLLMLEEALWYLNQRVERPQQLKCGKGTILVWEYCETKRLTPIMSSVVAHICQTFVATGDLHLTKTMLTSAQQALKKEIEGITKFL